MSTSPGLYTLMIGANAKLNFPTSIRLKDILHINNDLQLKRCRSKFVQFKQGLLSDFKDVFVNVYG